MKHLATFTLSLFTLAGAATTQSASFSTFGTPCTASEGTPMLSNNGLPVIGQTMDIRYAGPNVFGGVFQYRPHLIIGFNLFGSPPVIPAGLFPTQPAGCTLYARHHIVIPMPELLIPNTYQDVFQISIPNNPALAGMTFFPQWLTVYTQCGIVPPCWISWMATSEVGIATIGF